MFDTIFGGGTAGGSNSASGILGFLGGERQNYSNAKQAADMMKFQEDLSNTAHQREVADLRAAGLNPLLSVNKGASSPGGAMATMQNTVHSAMDAAKSRAEISNLKEMWHNINMDTSTKENEGVVKRRQEELLEQQRKTEVHATDEAYWSAQSAREAYSGHKQEGEIDREGTGAVSRRIQRFIPFFNSAGSYSRGFRVR